MLHVLFVGKVGKQRATTAELQYKRLPELIGGNVCEDVYSTGSSDATPRSSKLNGQQRANREFFNYLILIYFPHTYIHSYKIMP